MGHYTKIWDEYVTILLLIHTSFKYTMTVLVRPYWVKGGTNGISRTSAQEWRRKWFSPFLTFSLIWKIQSSLPARLYFSQVSIPIISLSTCHFVSCWILSEPRQENLTFSKSWDHVIRFNEKSVDLSPLLSLGEWGFNWGPNLRCGWVWVLSEGLWFQKLMFLS